MSPWAISTKSSLGDLHHTIHIAATTRVAATMYTMPVAIIISQDGVGSLHGLGAMMVSDIWDVPMHCERNPLLIYTFLVIRNDYVNIN
jgi:hypothetical protein